MKRGGESASGTLPCLLSEHIRLITLVCPPPEHIWLNTPAAGIGNCLQKKTAKKQKPPRWRTHAQRAAALGFSGRLYDAKTAALENTCAENGCIGFFRKTLSKTQGKPILA